MIEAEDTRDEQCTRLLTLNPTMDSIPNYNPNPNPDPNPHPQVVNVFRGPWGWAKESVYKSIVGDDVALHIPRSVSSL